MFNEKFRFLGFKIIVLVFILMFSCKNPKNEVDNKVDFCSQIHQDSISKLSTVLKFPTELINNKTGVYVLEDGGGSIITRAFLTENAEKSIDIQYFIFSTDNVGLIACDYLIRAADRGVKIRILVDDIMVDADIEDILTLDSHKNIEIKIYNPGVNLGKNLFSKIKKFATNFRSANQRMHNKTFIVDSKVIITGGRNIADEYFDYDHEYNFRDRDVLLLGKTTKNVQLSFNAFWNSNLSVPVGSLLENHKSNQDPKRFDNLHQYACNPENFWPQIRERITNMASTFDSICNADDFVWVDSVAFVSDDPGKNNGKQGLGGSGKCTDALIKLLKQAKDSIYIQTPYLITTVESRNLFEKAVKSGVKIKILTNSLASTDNLEAFNGYQRDRKKLLKTGVEIYEYKPDAAERFKIMTGALQSKLNYKPIFGLHAKSMVIDGKITVIGTFNLDPRSANLNTECITATYDKKISESVLNGMIEELKPENAWHTTLQFNPDDKVDFKKRVKTWTKRVIPKNIL
jgi:cardiolipin synthase C